MKNNKIKDVRNLCIFPPAFLYTNLKHAIAKEIKFNAPIKNELANAKAQAY